MQTTSKATATPRRRPTERPIRRPRKRHLEKQAFRHAMRSLRPVARLKHQRIHHAKPFARRLSVDDRRRGAAEDHARDLGASGTLQPFSLAPTVLIQPVTRLASEVHTVGSGVERAQAAALAERLLESVRVSRVGNRHEVHLRLAAAAGHGAIDVQLRHESGELTAVIRPDAGATSDARRLAASFARELRARGLPIRDIQVDLSA